jgi:hypothetical protein
MGAANPFVESTWAAFDAIRRDGSACVASHCALHDSVGVGCEGDLSSCPIYREADRVLHGMVVDAALEEVSFHSQITLALRAAGTPINRWPAVWAKMEAVMADHKRTSP